MRIACVGYREWALDIYDALACQTDHQFLIFRSKAQYNELALRDFKPDLVLFYGWSWIVDSLLVRDIACLMLHPAPLPKYRGGSPLQNQIIRGETESSVTLFVMDDGLDAGPIIAQAPLNLAGDISDIFHRITDIGIQLTLSILPHEMIPVPQNHEEATYFPRRKPEESEITLDELCKKPSNYLNNKIRMLQSPYPHAFIRTVDGKKLVILRARLED